MRLAGIYAIRKQGYRRGKKSAASTSMPPNILRQDFSATDLNQKWLADIAYVATKEGWLHDLPGSVSVQNRQNQPNPAYVLRRKRDN